MSTKAHQLMWNRVHQTLPLGYTTVDTGLTQVSQAFSNSSVNEPPLDGSIAIASRVQVIPLSPIPYWYSITHAEPFVNANGTVSVRFRNTGQGTVTINILFWNPHTDVGPGDADTYLSPLA